MKVEEYIESGILEAYLMGELDEDQCVEVDQMAAEHPEISAELEEIRASIQQYAHTTKKAPSRSILENTLATIEEESPAQSDIPTIQKFDEKKTSSNNVIWRVAASILLIISVGFNIYFFNQGVEKDKRILQLTQDRTRLADDIQFTNLKLANTDEKLQYYLDENHIKVRMGGVDLSPESYATVFWNKQTNDVLISCDNLPKPPEGKQYQLWAIKEGQAPIDAGIFDFNEDVQKLKVIRGDVLAFAVTLEDLGGTPIASVDQTYVKGYL